MKRYAMLFTLVMTLILSVSLAVAQPMGKGPAKGMGKGMMNLPDLTPDQLTQIKKLRLEHQKEMLPIRTKIQTARLEMQSLMLENADQKTVEKKIEEIGKLRIEAQKKRYAHHMAVREILTDEQKAIFDARPLWMGRHGRGDWDDDNCDGPDGPRRPRHRRW